jgi:hypothetical protein
MLPYSAPIDDFAFLLRDVFEMENFWAAMQGTAEFTIDDALSFPHRRYHRVAD